ncbi:MAG TPA: ComF family protein [Clostridiales bacterium]|nr:ComF family protein [Clostridiales bacterium]
MRGELFDRMVSLVFPKGCVLCGATVAYDDLVCSRCTPDRREEHTCLFCGNPINRCLCETRWDFDGAAAPLHYRAETRGAVLQLKKLPDRRIARYLAEEMYLCLRREFPDVAFDWITEVPMHPEKLQKRGFNQGELLAAQLAVLSGVFHRMRLLTCSGPLEYQHTLSRNERFAAVRDRYALAGSVRGKTILLVDDVLTTGATAQACAACLKEGGAAKVYVLTAAATPLSHILP